MFSISSKGLYGVSAVLEMALRHGKGPIQIKSISESRKIPQHYLEQILVQLKRGKIVKSFRGAQGGYALTGTPATTNLLEVLTLLEGPIEMTRPGPGDSQLEFFWQNLSAEIIQALDISMAELIEQIQSRQATLNFVI